MTELGRAVAGARAALVELTKGRKHSWPVYKDGPVPTTPPAPAKPDEVATPATREFRGIPVVVDRPKGFVQEGVGADGKPWRRVYHVDYGHIRHSIGTDDAPGTLGGDGDGLDVFLGGDESAPDAHWVLQRKADGTFDEYKVMLGFADRPTAKAMYLAHVPARYFGSMCSMPVEMMKALLGIEPCEDLTKALAGLRGIVESAADEGAAVARQMLADAVSGRRHDLPDPVAEKVLRVLKASPPVDELRYALGVVLEPEVVDAQGDIYSADEIRKSAWNYMVNFRNVGLMHKGLVNGKVQLVESYVAPEDMTVGGSAVKRGTWLMGLHFVDDELWGKVQAGELTGLSIGGFAKRTEV